MNADKLPFSETLANLIFETGIPLKPSKSKAEEDERKGRDSKGLMP